MATTDPFGARPARRLDSLDASRADLYGGPSVLLPPKHLMASSDNNTAMEIENARHHLDEEVSSEDGSPQIASSPVSRPAVSTTDEFALAFDIDGVLIRGGKPIPEAVDALKYINGENPYGIKVYVLPQTEECGEKFIDC